LSNETAVAITNSSGATLGYSCYVSGTFVWLAAGGGWGTAIRVGAPSSGAVGVDYFFYDTNGNDLDMDTTLAGGPVTPDHEVSFSLYNNQPAEVDLLGASSTYPGYTAVTTGSVYATFYCAVAATCRDINPQLIYSAIPSSPWLLTVPIAWDTALWTQWSAVGVDDGGENRISFVVYNEDTVATSYTIDVFDNTGTLVGKGTTPVIAPLQSLGNGALGQGGTYGALLSDVIPRPLPAGPFKVLIDGGTRYSAVEVLQFDGPAATNLQIAYDTAPNSAVSSRAKRPASVRSLRAASRPARVFPPLAKTK
jgi:hypothetical protein